MADDVIARLRGLLGKSSLRPWQARYSAEAVVDAHEETVCRAEDCDNLDLIAEAVSALPGLLDRLERAEAELAEYRAHPLARHNGLLVEQTTWDATRTDLAAAEARVRELEAELEDAI